MSQLFDSFSESQTRNLHNERQRRTLDVCIFARHAFVTYVPVCLPVSTNRWVRVLSSDSSTCSGLLCFALLVVIEQAGELLASRIYGRAKEEMDYSLVATAVFTPVSLSALFFCRMAITPRMTLAL